MCKSQIRMKEKLWHYYKKKIKKASSHVQSTCDKASVCVYIYI